MDDPARNELLREQQRLKLILDGVRDHAISMLDLEGRVETINAPAQRIKGYALEELRGQHIRVFFTAEDRAAGLPERELAVARTQGRFEGEGWRLRKDGSRFYAAVSLSALHDARGRPVGFVKVTQDITERRRLGEALRQRESELELIINTIPALVAYVGPDQTYRVVNRAYEEWFGLTRAALVGRHMRDVLGVAAYAEVRPHVEAALAGRTTTFETTVPYRHGPARQVRATYVPHLGLDGEVLGYIGLVLDETEQIRARRELQQAQQDLEVALRRVTYQHRLTETITQNATAALFLMDARQRCTFMNRAAEAMTGYSFEEVRAIDRPLHDFIHPRRPDGRPYPLEECPIDRALPQRAHTTGEDVFQRKDGTFYPVAFTASPIVEGERPMGTVIEVRDTTREKREQSAARLLALASTTLAGSLDYRATVQRVAEHAVELLASWCVVYVRDDAGSGGAIELTAVAHRDPARVSLLRALHACYPPAAGDPFGPTDVLETGRAELAPQVHEVVYDAMARDAEHRALLRQLGATSWMMAPLEAHGRRLGALGLGTAGAARRFDEADLEVARELGRRVGVAIDNARLFELSQRERRRAEEANRAKDELLSVTSHELRTPLTAVLGWTRMLRTGAVPEARREHALETIERNARMQVQLVEDLLDFSRVITGQLRLAIASVDLAQVVEAALDVVRPAADAKGVRLQVVLDPAAGPISGDAGRLQQVAWNLLSNAVKFTPRDGRVSVRTQRVGSHVELAVADSGVGIDPAFLPHVFQPFRQQDASITRTHGGLGLGLAIVKHLVELHGGHIEARSDGPGQGAVFTVQIPVAPVRPSTLAPPGGEAAPGAPAASARAGTGARAPELAGVDVLVCEDEPDARDLIEAILAERGAVVRTARSVAEALARFGERVPDVLVSDIGMPDASGYDLIRHVRARAPEQGGNVPAVALTAYASAADRTRALTEGFQNHVSKPSEPAELVAAVAALAGRGRRG